jgi:hypothetical protein
MHLIDKDKHGLKVKEGKQIFQANGAPKLAGIAILISYKAAIKPKLVEETKRSLPL